MLVKVVLGQQEQTDLMVQLVLLAVLVHVMEITLVVSVLNLLPVAMAELVELEVAELEVAVIIPVHQILIHL